MSSPLYRLAPYRLALVGLASLAVISTIGAQVVPIEICDNVLDDDADGLTDCADPDCDDSCVPPELCNGGIDEDGDDLIDCLDPDCLWSCNLPDEDCAREGDEDADGFADCLDVDCLEFSGCHEGGRLERFCGGPGNPTNPECSADRLRVVFASETGERSSTLEAQRFPPGREFVVSVDIFGRSQGNIGYGFGLRHDPEVLQLIRVGFEGTFAESFFPFEHRLDDGFAVTGLLWQSGVGGVPLPLLEESALVRAQYRVLEMPPEGTELTIVDDLRFPNQGDGRIALFGTGNRIPSILVHGLLRPLPPALFQRGDLDGNGEQQLTDAVLLLQGLFLGRTAPFDCESARDVNSDGSLNLTDAIALLTWLFQSGPAPEGPLLECAATEELRACRSSSPSCAVN